MNLLSSTTQRGAAAESLAIEEFLRAHPGSQVLKRNLRYRVGEVDFIAQCRDSRGQSELVFVEVRMRRPGNLQVGIESVRGIKWYRLQRSIQRYLSTYRGPAQSIRIDIMDWDGKTWTHFRHVWE